MPNAAGHRNVGDVPGPNVVRHRSRSASAAGRDRPCVPAPASTCSAEGRAPRSPSSSSASRHEAGHLVPFGLQQALQHPAACERILQMQLVDPAHQGEIGVRGRPVAFGNGTLSVKRDFHLRPQVGRVVGWRDGGAGGAEISLCRSDAGAGPRARRRRWSELGLALRLLPSLVRPGFMLRSVVSARLPTSCLVQCGPERPSHKRARTRAFGDEATLGVSGTASRWGLRTAGAFGRGRNLQRFRPRRAGRMRRLPSVRRRLPRPCA